MFLTWNALRPEQAVHILRLLLWAEASALGIAKNLISVPTAINVADGGIDAEVRDANPVGGQRNHKSRDHTLPSQNGKILTQGWRVSRLFCGRGLALRRISHREICSLEFKGCLDQGGTLVVLLFGSNNPNKEKDYP